MGNAKSKKDGKSAGSGRSQSAEAALLAVFGFAGVGKTSISLRLAEGKFLERTKLSSDDELTLAFAPKLSPSTAASFQAPRVRLVVPVLNTDSDPTIADWFSEIRGAFVVFDLTDVDSFKDIQYARWWEVLRRDPALPVVLLGTRVDEGGDREVSTSMARKWANENFLPYLEVSSLTGKNLNKALEAMLLLAKRASDGFPIRTQQSMAVSSSETESVR